LFFFSDRHLQDSDTIIDLHAQLHGLDTETIYSREPNFISDLPQMYIIRMLYQMCNKKTEIWYGPCMEYYGRSQWYGWAYISYRVSNDTAKW
jgi:hypothetical protein